MSHSHSHSHGHGHSHSHGGGHEDEHEEEIVRFQDEHASFFVIAQKGKTAAWRANPNLPLTAVLQAVHVYKGQHGTEGDIPSNSELDNSFGTTDVEAACRKILQHGKMIHH